MTVKEFFKECLHEYIEFCGKYGEYSKGGLFH